MILAFTTRKLDYKNKIITNKKLIISLIILRLKSIKYFFQDSIPAYLFKEGVIIKN